MVPYRDFFKIVQNPELQNGELKLPKNFLKMYGEKMPNPIFLNLPNGTHKWEMFWVERAGRIWFQKEWENFAKLLEYGYLLMFKYLGGSNFEVKILDCSTYEIDYSKIKCVEEEKEEDRSKDEKSGEECIEISETEGATEDRRTKASKRKNKNVDFNAKQKEVSAAKKAKKCSNTEAVKERAENSHSIDDQYPSFEISMGKSYVENSFVLLPTHFTREHMKGWEGKAIIRAAHDMSTSWKMTIKNSSTNERSVLGSGWKKFAQHYNLQVNDICKFVMTQRDPMSFTVTIPHVKVQPCPQKLQDSEDLNDGVKVNTFKITITTTQFQHIPHKFMKSHSRCHGTVKLKFGETSWFVKLIYYEQACAGRFYKGWTNFVKGCDLKIGDTCLFELIDEENHVFNVTRLN